MALTTYEYFDSNQTVPYGSQATSAGVNKGPLFLKNELNNLSNYVNLKFGENLLNWDAIHTYNVGDLCMRNGVIYKALVSNTNNQPNSPGWEIVDVLEDYVNSLLWDSGTNYVIYDVVVNDGVVYESLNSNTNSEPPSSNWNSIVNLGSSRVSSNFVKTDGNSEPTVDDQFNIGTTSHKFANIYATNLHGDMDGGSF